MTLWYSDGARASRVNLGLSDRTAQLVNLLTRPCHALGFSELRQDRVPVVELDAPGPRRERQLDHHLIGVNPDPVCHRRVVIEGEPDRYRHLEAVRDVVLPYPAVQDKR